MKRLLLTFLLALTTLSPLLAQDNLAGFYDHRHGYGFIDKSTHEIVIPPQFEEIDNFRNGLALVKLKGKYGFIDRTGEFIIPAQYTDLHIFHEGLASVLIDEYWGFIDKSGELVIPAIYSTSGTFQNGIARVNLYGRWIYIDKLGNSYKTPEEAEKAVNPQLIAQQKEFEKYAKMDFAQYINYTVGSFEDFAAKKGIKVPSETSINAIIEQEIAQWQKKGEFEKTADYQARVNDTDRIAKIKEISDNINNTYSAELNKVQRLYNIFYNDAADMYITERKKNFRKQSMTLDTYDADNESFLIHTENNGDILLNVPIFAAPNFKELWEFYKTSAEPDYVIIGNDVILKSVKFGDYVYDFDTK